MARARKFAQSAGLPEPPTRQPHGTRYLTASPSPPSLPCPAGPHKWAVGTTFEWEFDFPITTNPAYEAKPAPKRKTRTSANPKAASARSPNTSKPATVHTARPKASEKPKRVHLTPDERRERARARAVENRRKLKELSICKDCRKPVVPGQVRCSSCADKHRKSWKPRTSKGKDQDNMMN